MMNRLASFLIRFAMAATLLFFGVKGVGLRAQEPASPSPRQDQAKPDATKADAAKKDAAKEEPVE
jgi:hypothetical protein